MQAIASVTRNISRCLVNGVVQRSQHTAETAACRGQVDEEEGEEDTRLVTAVSGFPKPGTIFNIETILRGQIGDDAFFMARHQDDWTTDDERLKPATTEDEASSSDDDPLEVRRRQGGPCADVIGVADGVGGWRAYGIDPGLFSVNLMKSCERLVIAGYFSRDQPAKLLAQAFREIKENKQQIIGSSTACLMMLSHVDLKLYTANIGDSGFLVVRQGEVVHRSQEQQHYFNTPFQLSLPPTELLSEVLSDQPESADQYEFPVEDGDVILLATDGIFDNVPNQILVAEMDKVQNCRDIEKIQQCANSIALIARKLSKDPKFLSPFAKNARASGIEAEGGKPDDITVLLATVSL